MSWFLKLAVFANCPRCNQSRGYPVPDSGSPPIVECAQCGTRYQS